MDRDDVRVPQPGHLAGLDPALVHLAPGDRPVHPGHLHGDRPLQPGVEPPVDPPEAALADQGVEPVAVGQQPGQVVVAGDRRSAPRRRGPGLDRAVEPLDLAQPLDLAAEPAEQLGAVPAEFLRPGVLT